MWLFRRKKVSQYTQPRSQCSYCKSTNTQIISYSKKNGEPKYIKTWRGQRYLTFRCLHCGRDFYIKESLPNIVEALLSEESIIDDEDELLAAEEELKRQVDEEDDHRFKGNTPW